ncbi:8-amino-7-oxononanoate synthase [Alishewanella sp. 16-MA]|uniref:8-amino-7-oxononanoate synthase n=1 Tax=Alishewanella maricola TaxID=2795740 RepID=A0ABS8C602_9ALTE|nr:8-amino-7-oxononanoate synthase [Alishewanella maricola]MCB5227563.1 8-amino-7-oxononanoate synthase [Alishewanella maricola]
MHLSQLEHALQQRRSEGLLRQSQVIADYKGRYLEVGGQCYLNFSANDYLGLANSSKVKASYAAGAERYGAGSTGSPLVTGYHHIHQQLTAQLAAWLGFERVLLFSSGFAANQAMLQSLAASNDLLLLDKLSHASLIDAALAHKGGFRRFAHNDLNALARLLPETPDAENHSLVVTEGVFSMDGDSPDLVALSKLCQQRQAALLLDDAHGLGVLGEQGRGSWQVQGLASQQLYCYMANFGKALGVGGAFLAGSKTVIDYIEQFARHYIYSTALSPALCAAVSQSIELVQTEQWRRDKLQDNIQLFRSLAAEADLPCLPATGAIQAIMLGSSERAVALSQQLKQLGIWLTAIRQPTVPAGSARLRVTLSASHQAEDIQFLIKMLKQALAC